MALTRRQKDTARRKLAARRGVPASTITDADITTALANSVIAMTDLGDGGGGYNGGTGYSDTSGSTSTDTGYCG